MEASSRGEISGDKNLAYGSVKSYCFRRWPSGGEAFGVSDIVDHSAAKSRDLNNPDQAWVGVRLPRMHVRVFRERKNG